MASKKKSLDTPKLNPLLVGGEERGQGDRWSHDETNIGTTLLGRFTGQRPVTFADGKEGFADIFSPAVVMDADGALTCYKRIETLHAAAIAQKIDAESDKGIVFGIQYTGTEASKKKGRTAFKTFVIVEQEPAVLVKYLRDEGEKDLAALVTVAQ